MQWAVHPISQGDTSAALNDVDFRRNSDFGISHPLPQVLCWEGKIRTCALKPKGWPYVRHNNGCSAQKCRSWEADLWPCYGGESIPKGLLPFPPSTVAVQASLAAGERSAEQDYIRLLAMQKHADGLKVFHFWNEVTWPRAAVWGRKGVSEEQARQELFYFHFNWKWAWNLSRK